MADHSSLSALKDLPPCTSTPPTREFRRVRGWGGLLRWHGLAIHSDFADAGLVSDMPVQAAGPDQSRVSGGMNLA
jgi:hypothetical protein